MVLGQNFPNPFGPSTSIRYGIPARSHATIEIFDVAGRRIATLVNTNKRPGVYTEAWMGLDADGERVPSGIYFYKLSAGTRSLTKKMILVR
jgi:flagellar hook assembly protein FlgD